MQPAAPPVVLTIAGSDSSGGAGIQADLKVFAALGCYGASAITAITAQNTMGVQSAHLLDRALVRDQIEAVVSDFDVAAIKTGMLGSAEIVETVADALEAHGLHDPRPLVVDPVMRAKSGDALINEEAVEAIVLRLIPLAHVVTPNRHEAERLCGFVVDGAGAAARAAEFICAQLKARACVVKGIEASEDGHAVSLDFFCDGRHVTPLSGPRHDSNHTHGSGCAFSAAIAALLAQGQHLAAAVQAAKVAIDRALTSAMRLGRGVSPVDHAALAPPR